MPFEIHDEIATASGPLKDWITRPEVKSALVLNEEVEQQVFNHVIDTAYAPDLVDHELEEAGRDPFLVSYGLMQENRTIVTKEISSPSKIRGRRKVPDACDILNIPCISDFPVLRSPEFPYPVTQTSAA